MSSAVPTERCGYTLEPDDVGQRNRFENQSTDWYLESNAASCWREVWEGSDDGRCIWHTDQSDKPVKSLVDARAHDPERLAGAVLRGAQLRSLSFAGCDLTGVDFSDANVSGCDFSDSKLLAADFSDAFLSRADFTHADVRRARFPYADAREADFSSVNGAYAEFSDADLRQSSFTEAYLVNSSFPDVDAMEADFSDSVASQAVFPDAELRRTDFSEAQISKCDFASAAIAGADFDRANLTEASIADTFAERASFRDAELVRADCSDSLLDECSFVRADLRGADFTGASLYGAKLSQVMVSNSTQFAPIIPVGDDLDELEKAEWVSRSLYRELEANGLSGKAREFRIHSMNLQRRMAWMEGRFMEWYTLTAYRWTTRYGESAWRPFALGINVILISALTYPFVGGIKNTNTMVVYSFANATNGGMIVETFLQSITFSVFAFTNAGLSPLRPAGRVATVLASVEGFLGLVIIILTAVMLGRQTARG